MSRIRGRENQIRSFEGTAAVSMGGIYGGSRPKSQKSARPAYYSASGSAAGGAAAVGRQKNKKAKKAGYYPENYYSRAADQVKPRNPHKGRKIFLILLAVLVGAAACAYLSVAYYYKDKFINGTIINGIDCSGLTAYEVENILAHNIKDYSISVSARGLNPEIITGDKIAYQYCSNGDVLNLLENQNSLEWIMGYRKTTSYTIPETTAYSKALLREAITSLSCAKDFNQIEPEDAYVAYDGTEFVIIPETEGCSLNVRAAFQALEASIDAKERSIDFNSIDGIYDTASVKSDDPEILATLDACRNYTRASITYDLGSKTEVLDGSVIKDWLQFDDNGQLKTDDSSFEQCVADYVAKLAEKYDTVGTERQLITTSGRTVYITGSAYGWLIDQTAETSQLIQEIMNGETITREPVYAMTANDHGDLNDFGDTYIEVDLAYQCMYYYKNGALIFSSDIVSGLPSNPSRATPTGIYTLYYKKSPETLRGEQRADGSYEYESQVTYWMPFNGGVGFHDANWQSSFGGDTYLYSGSHGCINLPYSAAQTLYDIIEYDVPILVFN